MSFDFEFTALLQLLWRASWQAFVIAIIVLFITSMLRRWITPRWRAIMWTLPLARMILLLIPASGLSMFHLLDFESSEAIPVATLTPSTTINDEMTGTSHSAQPNKLRTSHQNVTEVPHRGTNVSNSPLEESKTGLTISLSSLLTCIWVIGSCVALCWWIGSKFVLSRIIAGSEPLQDEELLELIALRQKRGRLWFPIRCFVTDTDLGPSLCGFWRPTILLPRKLWVELSKDELQSIIHHEIEHIRRWDVLYLLITRVAKTMYWFNPVAYMIGNRLRREIEMAVDAATISTFDEQARYAYGELLIRLSQSTRGPIAAIQMAGKHSALRARIDQLATPIQESRFRSLISIILILVLFVTGLSDVGQTQEQPRAKKASSTVTKATKNSSQNESEKQYFITGTVREARTGKPVTDAEIEILVASEQDPKEKFRKGITNESGQYRIEASLGNVQMWFPKLKPGYWLKPEEYTSNLTTTPDNPVVVHDLTAQTGAVWNVQVKGNFKDKHFRFITSLNEIEDDAKRAAWIKGEPVSFQKMYATSSGTLNQKGLGSLTEVGTSGKFMVSVANQSIEFIVEPGFDNSQVVSLKHLPNSDMTQMFDTSGKKATINKATVTLNNGIPLLTFQYEPLKPIGIRKLTGRVIDTNGNPLAEVRVGVVLSIKGGGSDTGEATNSAVDGTFSLDLPVYSIQDDQTLSVSIFLTKNGFAGIDSQKIDISKDFSPIDFKTLTLRPGYSIPVRVLDEQGKPLPGAVVQPGSGYALWRQKVRTAADGRALIKNMPSGVIKAFIYWGTKTKETNLFLSKNRKENKEVSIRLNELETSTTANVEKPKPLAVGKIAPEWNISEWSDGRTHKLSDYRGQVVVLDFWGLRCSGCVASIPAQKKLVKNFANRGVVFLGIHTADGEISQINKLKENEQWKTPTGVDRGTSILDGVSGKSYGVDSYPTLIVIDATGKIAFRSDVEPSEDRETFMQNLAEASGINWPPPKDATQEQMIEIMNKIQYEMMSREINRVLDAKR